MNAFNICIKWYDVNSIICLFSMDLLFYETIYRLTIISSANIVVVRLM